MQQETVQRDQPDGVPPHFAGMARTVYVSTPNLLTRAPPGADKSGNPWHLREYRVAEFRALCESVFERVELYGLFHARKLRAHELARRAADHEAVLRPLHAGHRRARLRAAAGRPRGCPRLRRDPEVTARRPGALAPPPPTHIPYVEG